MHRSVLCFEFSQSLIMSFANKPGMIGNSDRVKDTVRQDHPRAHYKRSGPG